MTPGLQAQDLALELLQFPASGYAQRFGLVYVDYPTLERVPKSSYSWYRDLIAASMA